MGGIILIKTNTKSPTLSMDQKRIIHPLFDKIYHVYANINLLKSHLQIPVHADLLNPKLPQTENGELYPSCLSCGYRIIKV